MSAYSLTGLVLVLPDGRRWRWIGHRMILGRERLKLERVERWERTCASCGKPMVVAARVIGNHRQEYFQQRVLGRELHLPVDGALYPALASRRECRTCRRQEAAA